MKFRLNLFLPTLIHTSHESQTHAQIDLVTVRSHIARHNQVSSPFTCCSVQQGFYVAASVGRRGSKYIRRAPAETTEPRVLLLLLLCSKPGGGEHRGADGEEFQISKGFFLFPSLFYPTGSGQMQTQHTGVCVHVCSVCLSSQSKQNLNSATHCPVCVVHVCVSVCEVSEVHVCIHIQVTSGESHVLFSSPPDPTSRSDTTAVCVCVCVFEHVCLCVNSRKCVQGSEKSHMKPLCHTVTQFIPYVLVIKFSTLVATVAACFLKHQHNACPSRGKNRAPLADTTLGSDGGGI